MNGRGGDDRLFGENGARHGLWRRRSRQVVGGAGSTCCRRRRRRPLRVRRHRRNRRHRRHRRPGHRLHRQVATRIVLCGDRRAHGNAWKSGLHLHRRRRRSTPPVRFGCAQSGDNTFVSLNTTGQDGRRSGDPARWRYRVDGGGFHPVAVLQQNQSLDRCPRVTTSARPHRPHTTGVSSGSPAKCAARLLHHQVAHRGAGLLRSPSPGAARAPRSASRAAPPAPAARRRRRRAPRRRAGRRRGARPAPPRRPATPRETLTSAPFGPSASSTSRDTMPRVAAEPGAITTSQSTSRAIATRSG